VFTVVFSVGLVAVLCLAAWAPLWPRGESDSAVLGPLHLLVLVPLAEELYFRGLLFEHLRQGFSSVAAALLCSLLFALLHLPAGGVLGAGALSLAACLLVLRSGVLAYAVQLHVALNGLAQVNYLADPASRWVWVITASGMIVLMAALCVARPRACDR
jgi:membrane protease YdiL (CAAX protease family)